MKSQIDKSSIKTGFLLNLGLSSNEIEKIKAYKDKYSTGVLVTHDDWKQTYNALTSTELSTTKLQNVNTLQIAKQVDKPKNTEIGIGLVSLDGNNLTTEQLQENINATKQKKTVNGSKYEVVDVFLASLLQDEVYQSQVNFKIDLAKMFMINDNGVKEFSIDFGDGKGYQKTNFKQGQLIPYTFTSIGERIISLKFVTKRGTYISYVPFNVSSLSPPKYSKELSLSASTQITNPNAKVAAAFTTGKASVVLGCDGVFDRPIIIIEGFDPTNENTIDNYLSNKYTYGFRELLGNGYDLVYLDFNDARTYIQNNANVLIDLINQVNATKVGNNKLVVLGESMGGLVARYALRKMEMQGMNHNTKLYISFDTPHKGANVPIGIQLAAKDALTLLNIPLFYNLLPTSLRNYVDAANAPSAQQMLMEYFGKTPHSNFTAFQNEINAMGYPIQCKNVAMLNGSITGVQQKRTNQLSENPGELLAQVEGVYSQYFPLYSYNAKVWTNLVNQQTTVSTLFATAAIVPIYQSKSINQPFNYDLIPGGNYAVSNYTQSNLNTFVFSFIPTFSAIDYKGALNSQAAHSINATNASKTNGLSPFDKVYGNDVNDRHVNVAAEATSWKNLFAEQLGVPINNWANCSTTLPTLPPTPYFNMTNYLPCAGYTFKLYDINTLNGIYDTPKWTIQPGNKVFYGNSLTVTPLMLPQNIPYTVTCTLTYKNTFNSTSYSSTIYGICRNSARLGGEEDDNILAENQDNTILYPNPAHEETLFESFLEEGETAILEVRDNFGNLMQSKNIKATEQNEAFQIDVSNLSNGLYHVYIFNDNKKQAKKMIVNH